MDDKFAELDRVTVRLPLRIHKGKGLCVSSVCELYNLGFADLLQPSFQALAQSDVADRGHRDRKKKKAMHEFLPEKGPLQGRLARRCRQVRIWPFATYCAAAPLWSLTGYSGNGRPPFGAENDAR